MIYKNLQEKQRKLDTAIHGKVQGLSMLYDKTVALSVELDEWFVEHRRGNVYDRKEELIDCLHFALSLANIRGVEISKVESKNSDDIVLSVVRTKMELLNHMKNDGFKYWSTKNMDVASYDLALINMIGFLKNELSWEFGTDAEIEENYTKKWLVNFERVQNGY